MDHRGRVQLMDFGLAQLEGVSPRQVAGTPWTMSPAAFKQGDDGRAGDWWSLGVVLYQLLQVGVRGRGSGRCRCMGWNAGDRVGWTSD